MSIRFKATHPDRPFETIEGIAVNPGEWISAGGKCMLISVHVSNAIVHWFAVEGENADDCFDILADFKNNYIDVDPADVANLHDSLKHLDDDEYSEMADKLVKIEGWVRMGNDGHFVDLSNVMIHDDYNICYVGEGIPENTDPVAYREWYNNLPNLDCMDSDDIEAYYLDSSNPNLLREYAKIKFEAIKHRTEKRIAVALGLENYCEYLYKNLPSYMKW